MARRNLFEKLTHPSSSHPLRPFDLSQRKVYSSRVGLCLPELCMEVYKGDKFKIDTTVFNRSDKLLAPAYFRCKQFHHFFFVPYHTLWHEWDSFFTRSTEKLSSATYGANYFPNVDIFDFINRMVVGGSGTDMMGYSSKPGWDRMLQMLGCGSLSILDNIASPSISGKYVNLARVAAYNKIWYWYYRDKRHMPPTLFNDFVKYYNLDDIDTSTIAGSHVDLSDSTKLARIQNMFLPKYRTWDSDVFSNSFVDTQFGSVSVLNAEKVTIRSDVDPANLTGYGDRYKASFYRGLTTDNGILDLRDTQNSDAHVVGSTLWNIPSLFDILQLRKAQAVQHWRELMLRAGDSSKDRYVAMFGSHPKRSEEAPTYIGGFDVNLNIDDVTSSSYNNQQTTGNNKGLGDLAGKGIMSSSGNHIEFEAPDAGIVMCISSILPLAEYDGTQIDKANTLIEPNDFFVPQYDNLGFEPVMRWEQSIATIDIVNGYVDTVIGYTVRNHHLKTAVDRVYNNFRSGKSESYWSCVRRDLGISNPNLNYNLNYRNYYVSPVVVNPLFDRQISAATSSPDSAYNEDQFKCLTYFDIKALRPMSELGLPPL